jgi:uncharacterized protein (TIGR02246 family)
MMKIHALLLGVMIGFVLPPAADFVESASRPTSADEQDVRDLYKQLRNGWNAGSGVAFASVFSEDADLVGPTGLRLRGRDRIASFHQVLFDGILKDTSFAGDITSVRFLTNDVAVVHAIGGPSRSSDSTEPSIRRSLHTFVAVRRHGRWFIETFQSTPD